jgi:hypothetical protein
LPGATRFEAWVLQGEGVGFVDECVPWGGVWLDKVSEFRGNLFNSRPCAPTVIVPRNPDWDARKKLVVVQAV